MVMPAGTYPEVQWQEAGDGRGLPSSGQMSLAFRFVGIQPSSTKGWLLDANPTRRDTRSDKSQPSYIL